MLALKSENEAPILARVLSAAAGFTGQMGSVLLPTTLCTLHNTSFMHRRHFAHISPPPNPTNHTLHIVHCLLHNAHDALQIWHLPHCTLYSIQSETTNIMQCQVLVRYVCFYAVFMFLSASCFISLLAYIHYTLYIPRKQWIDKHPSGIVLAFNLCKSQSENQFVQYQNLSHMEKFLDKQKRRSNLNNFCERTFTTLNFDQEIK